MHHSGPSWFIAGMLVGLLVATTGFSMLVRHQNQAGGAQRAVTVLKLGHILDPSHPVHLAMERMAQLLAEKSGGTVELRVFPSGQLGSETDTLEQVQHGALAMTKTSTAPLESFVPELAVFTVPYVFRDDAHYWRILEGPIGRRLLEAGSEKGLRGLCYYDSGARSFYTIDKAVLTPNDLQGLKIRVMKSKTSMDMVAALGASPTPIPFGELYTALQQKMVDGAENNPPSFYLSRHFEVCKHYSLDEHARIPDILLMSESVWQSLSPQVRQWIQEAADESAVYQRELWEQENKRSLEAVQQEGVTVHYPDQAPFASQVIAMHQAYQGTPLGDLLSEIAEE
jgi:tripartite ATP-independent transporter DctP family solute receptor